MITPRDTSAAAKEFIDKHAPTVRVRVLEYLRACGEAGSTDEEAQEALNLNPSTQRGRRSELTKDGCVCGTDRVRKTRSGCLSIVWIVRPEPHRETLFD